jgi:hypothetical protein
LTARRTNPCLEQAITSALAVGRVDDAPYAAVAYLRRVVAAYPQATPMMILVANGFAPDPQATWQSALWALADLWSDMQRDRLDELRRAPQAMAA